MLREQKNTRKQGDVGLGAAIAYFTSIGVTVCLPLTDNQNYDLVIEDNGLKRVQVKTTYHKAPSGNYRVALRTCGGNQSRSSVKFFDCNSVELLFVLADNGARYLIPTSSFGNLNTLTLCKKYEQYLLGN
jgi:hypothetical protein